MSPIHPTIHRSAPGASVRSRANGSRGRSVSLVVLLFLAIVWAVFLVPQVLRARAEKTPSDSIGAFRNQLNVLDRMAPGAPARAPRSLAHGSAAVPMHRPVGVRRVSQKELVRRRRTNILVGLLASMGLTLV